MFFFRNMDFSSYRNSCFILFFYVQWRVLLYELVDCTMIYLMGFLEYDWDSIRMQKAAIFNFK